MKKAAATPLQDMMASKEAAKPTTPPPPADFGTKGLTIKMTGDRYRKLRQLAMDEDRTHQEIMVAAFDAYMQALGR